MAQAQALPPLRPLVLVAKGLLKEAGLNDAASGGLSSYALVNMVRFDAMVRVRELDLSMLLSA